MDKVKGVYFFDGAWWWSDWMGQLRGPCVNQTEAEERRKEHFNGK